LFADPCDHRAGVGDDANACPFATIGAVIRRIRRLAPLVLAAQLITTTPAAGAHQSPRSVRYHGYRVAAPPSWPVYDLSRDPSVCVRFNRHAVYLGTPGPEQRCPAHAVGRTEAILITPLLAAAARAATNAPQLTDAATSFAVPSAGVTVTATWGRDKPLVARALQRTSLPPPHTATAPRAASAAAARPAARGASVRPLAHTAGAIYTGLGFDACAAPSPRAMSAWASSPYRAVNIYIGGAVAACSQPNLTATWVANEVAAGWYLIPTYVGLQAPGNSCGCKSFSPSQASSQGTAAANDAVANAVRLGIPAGNPIYYDMEAYAPSTATSIAVETYLAAWTAQLHALGYLSGVYSSGASGIADLVSVYGTSYREPDDLWIAEWNGVQSTSSQYVPAPDWSAHQRIHQYSGGQNETHGGVTLNIDGNYVDAATANTSGGILPSLAPPPPAAKLKVLPALDGTTNLDASFSGSGTVSLWRVLVGDSPTALTPIAGAPAIGAKTRIVIRSAASYFQVQALDSNSQLLTTSPAVAAPAHLAIYARSAYVTDGSGVSALPAGCYTGSPCRVTTTLSAGGVTIARSRPESVHAGAAGLVYFQLTARGRTMLAGARAHRLMTVATVRDVSGAAASTTVQLIRFSIAGRGPRRHVTQSQTLRIVGVTDFVSRGGAGGILAGCVNAAQCHASVTLSLGRTVIAQSGPVPVGANELGYVFFKLSARGRQALANASGNQLGARLTLSGDGATATATVALVQS
jgi:hypothetical protein